MNWDAIGAVGEVVGAAGVIITLWFLAHQLRQNTQALKAEGFRDVIQTIHMPTSFVIQNGEVADIFVRGSESYSNLAPADQLRFHYLMVQRLHSVEGLHQYEQSGMVLNWVLKSGDRIIERAATQNAFREWWNAKGHAIFGPEFAAFVQSQVEANEG